MVKLGRVWGLDLRNCQMVMSQRAHAFISELIALFSLLCRSDQASMFLWLALAWGSAIASRASAGQPSATAGTCQSPAGAHLLMQCPLQPAGKQQEEAQQQHAHWIIQLASWEVAASHHAALTVAVPGEHTSWHWGECAWPSVIYRVLPSQLSPELSLPQPSGSLWS